MKIKNIIILAGGALFAWLFYQQELGINYTLYSFFVIAALAALHPQATKSGRWWLAAGALVVSAGCMAIYGNALCFFAGAFSLMLLAGFTARSEASAIANFVQSGFSFLLAVPTAFKEWNVARARRETGHAGAGPGWLVYVLVAGVFLLFLLLYSSASSAFREVLGNIEFKFVSFGWIITFCFGFVFTAGLLRHRRIKFIDRIEKGWGQPLIARIALSDSEKSQLTFENRTGRLLLVLLNLLLLAVNISDIVFLSGGMGNYSYEEYAGMVHEGIGALIMSIVIAVGILLVFFRGQLNFEKSARVLYILALVWIAQNLVLVATSCIKNSQYIYITSAITHKRIGVYYYLLLAAIGLLITAYKLYAKKPNWYLVKANFVAFCTVLVASCTVNWNPLITNYNIQTAMADKKDPDVYYLLRESENNLPQLVQWAQERKADTSLLYGFSTADIDEFCSRLADKVERFEERYRERGWQSWNYTSYKTYDYLKYIHTDSLRKPLAEPEGFIINHKKDYDSLISK